MPMYEYQCESCGEIVEVRQAMSDAKLKTCAQVVKKAEGPTKACGSAKAKVNRLISGTSFVLKGSGWYRDGYSSAAPKKGGDGGEAGGKSEGASAKPESKPETKSESKAA